MEEDKKVESNSPKITVKKNGVISRVVTKVKELADQAEAITTAVINSIVKDEEKEKLFKNRQLVCAACPHRKFNIENEEKDLAFLADPYNKNLNISGNCGKCGCNLAWRTRSEADNWACPDKRWRSYNEVIKEYEESGILRV